MAKQVDEAAVREVRMAYGTGTDIPMPYGSTPRAKLRRAIHAIVVEDIRKMSERRGITLRQVGIEASRTLDARNVERPTSWFTMIMHGNRIPDAEESAAIAKALSVETPVLSPHMRHAAWTLPNSMIGQKPAKPGRKRKPRKVTERADPPRPRGRPRKAPIPAIVEMAHAGASDVATIGERRMAEAEAVRATIPAAPPRVQTDTAPRRRKARPKVETAPLETPPAASGHAMPKPPKPAWPRPDAFGLERPDWTEEVPLEIETTDGRLLSQTFLAMTGGDPDKLRRMAFSLETTAAVLRAWADRAEMQKLQFGPKG